MNVNNPTTTPTSNLSDPAFMVDLATSRHIPFDAPFYAPTLTPISDPTRVAFAGCWHGRYDLIGPVMQAAATAGADVLVHTGDFLYDNPTAGKALYVIDEWAKRLNMPVVAVRGNHDNPALYHKAVVATRRRNKTKDGTLRVPDGFARLSEHVLHAPNGLTWVWNGVRFGALGGAFSVDRAARMVDVSYWSGEVVTPRDVSTLTQAGPIDVLVTHDVPTGAVLNLPATRPEWWDIENAEKHRLLLRKAVDAVRPSWVVAGHMHLRQTTGFWIHDDSTPQQVRVDVLNRVESGIPENLLVCDLVDGAMNAVTVTL